MLVRMEGVKLATAAVAAELATTEKKSRYTSSWTASPCRGGPNRPARLEEIRMFVRATVFTAIVTVVRRRERREQPAAPGACGHPRVVAAVVLAARRGL